MALLLCLALPGCETKVSEVTAVCRPGADVTAPVRWDYTSKADPSLIRQIPRAIDITLHYPGTAARQAPPVTTYFYRDGGAVLRVVATTTASMPPKGSFTYHVDTGGYDQALMATGRGGPEALAFFVVVDGSAFGGLLSPQSCGRWADGHLELGTATKLPDLKDRHPLNMAQSDWLEVVPLPPSVVRVQGAETASYAFFKAPIALTESKNETTVPDGLAKQEAEIGVTPQTALFSLTREPSPDAAAASSARQGGKP